MSTVVPQGWVTLLELDRAAGLPKGNAFRAFKALAATLVEEHDFRVLRHDTAADAIGALRSAGRIYPGSVNVVLLAPAAAQRIADRLSAHAQAGR